MKARNLPQELPAERIAHSSGVRPAVRADTWLDTWNSRVDIVGPIVCEDLGRCHAWLGRKDSNGVPVVSVGDNVERRAVDVAWYLEHRCWPSAPLVQICGFRLCVRVEHLAEPEDPADLEDAVPPFGR